MPSRRGRALLQRCLAILLAVSAVVVVAVAADAGTSKQQGAGPLLELTSDSFTDAVERQTGPALVTFVVKEKCESCKQLTPELAKVAVNLEGLAAVGTVDCSNPAAVRTCRSYGAHSFPKILVFKPGSKVNPYTGGSMKDFEQYSEQRVSARSLIDAVTNTLDTTQLPQISTAQQAQDFLAKEPQLPKVLLFTNRPASSVLAKAMSWAYVRRLAIAEVREGSSAGGSEAAVDATPLAQQYGVTQYPTVLLVKADGSPEPYSGSLKAPELRAWLDTHALPEPLQDSQGAGGQAGGLSDPLRGLGQVVVHTLNPRNVTDIDGQADMWLIAFYATTGSEGCDAELAALHKLLVEVQGLVNYGSLNTTGVEAALLEPFQLDQAALSASPCSPQLVLLPHGAHKQRKGDNSRWTGALDDAKALQAWILKAVPDFTSQITSDSEAAAFLDATAADLPVPVKPAAGGAASAAAERHAPVGKVLLFTTRDEVPGVFKALALHFAGKARLLFAWTKVDPQKGPSYSLMQKMNVRKAPAVTILFPLPPKPLGTEEPDEEGGDESSGPRNSRDNMALQQYMGPLKFQKMLAWLTAMSSVMGMSHQVHAGATKGPAPEHFEITTQQQLQTACYDQPGLCLVTLLDGRSDTANKYRDTVKQAAAAHAGQPVNWVVVDVSRQPSFRRAYGFTADQLPALLAVSTKRMRFAQGAAPFSEATAKQLVTKVLTGTAVTLPLPSLPQLVDGGEAEEVVDNVEEEFRLDEVMAEEVNQLFKKEERLKQADDELQIEERQKQEAKKKKKRKSSKKKKKAKQKQTSKGGGSSSGSSSGSKDGTAASKDEL